MTAAAEPSPRRRRPWWWRFLRRSHLVVRYYLRKTWALLSPALPPPADPPPPDPDLVLDLGVIRLGVVAGRSDVRAELDRLFPGAVRPFTAGTTVAATLTYGDPGPEDAPDPTWVTCSVDRAAPTATPVAELSGRILAVVNHLVLAAEPDLAHLHAGAAVVAGRAVVVPGSSGRGKTTLVAHLASGGELLSDEMVAVTPDGDELQAVLRPLSLKAGVEDVLGGVLRPGPARPAGAVAWWVPAEAIGARHRTSAPPGAIVLVARRPGPVEVDEGDDAAALEALLANAYDLPRNPVESVAACAALVARSRVLVVRYQEAAEVVAPLTARLEAGAVDPRRWTPLVWEGPPAGAAPSEAGRGSPRPAAGVITAVLGERAVLYHGPSRRIVRLDPAGTAAWSALTGDEPVPPHRAAFVADLAGLGLVEEGSDA